MVDPPGVSISTTGQPRWPYEEYYLGEKDDEGRKNGEGEYHWTGAQSIEWYKGTFVRNTMHGYGEYRWRYKGQSGKFVTYEGMFYANQLHGFGTMSYPDGRVFTGFYYKNLRYGPGVEYTMTGSNVGLWDGTRLVRLTWKPPNIPIAPDLTSGPAGPSFLSRYRKKLVVTEKIIGETNSAIELLKEYGADPQTAAELWPKLYSVYCTDQSSVLCHKEHFEYEYYKGKMITLEEVDPLNMSFVSPSSATATPTTTDVTVLKDDEEKTSEKDETPEKDKSSKKDPTPEKAKTYFAWNNNNMYLHMMQHTFKHEHQRTAADINIKQILSGPRSKYRRAAKHEYDCRALLMASFMGNLANVIELINAGIFPDIADMQGNTALMYAVSGDSLEVVEYLITAGASVHCYNDSCCSPLAVALMRYVCVFHGVSTKDMANALLGPPNDELVRDQPKEWMINRVTSTKIAPPEGHPPLRRGISMTSRRSSMGNLRRMRTQSFVDNMQRKASMALQRKASMASALQRKASSVLARHRKSSVGALPSTTKNFRYGLSGLNLKKAINNMKKQAEADSELDLTDDTKLYFKIKGPFNKKTFNLLTELGNMPQFLFHVNNIVKDVMGQEEDNEDVAVHKSKKEVKRALTKTLSLSLLTPTASKVSFQKRMLSDLEAITMNNLISGKIIDTLFRIQQTIEMLMSHGARPTEIRVPWPAVLLAAKTGSPGILRLIARHGIDVNERIPEVNNYTALEFLLSEPLSEKSTEMVSALLAAGANAANPVPYQEMGYDEQLVTRSGPTLLEIVWAKPVTSSTDQIYRDEIIAALLEYDCDPFHQLKGRSVIDKAAMQNSDTLDVILRHPKVDLNKVINDKGQTILLKLFSIKYIQSTKLIDDNDKANLGSTIPRYPYQNLMRYGADPFIKCYDQDNEYANIFEYIKCAMIDVTPQRRSDIMSALSASPKTKHGSNKLETIQKKDPNILTEYKDAFTWMSEHGCQLHVRWLQAKLVKELLDIVYKFKHRPWHNIINECKNINTAPWVTPARCLEIWRIFQRTKKKMYSDDKVLKPLLYIVHFKRKRLEEETSDSEKPAKKVASRKQKENRYPITAAEKGKIESDIASVLKENRKIPKTDVANSKQHYIPPELDFKSVSKYEVCIDCCLPLTEESLPCSFCKLVSYCNYDCMYANAHERRERAVPHYCNKFLILKYFPFSTLIDRTTHELKRKSLLIRRKSTRK